MTTDERHTPPVGMPRRDGATRIVGYLTIACVFAAGLVCGLVWGWVQG